VHCSGHLSGQVSATSIAQAQSIVGQDNQCTGTSNVGPDKCPHKCPLQSMHRHKHSWSGHLSGQVSATSIAQAQTMLVRTIVHYNQCTGSTSIAGPDTCLDKCPLQALHKHKQCWSGQLSTTINAQEAQA
jgi:hypothetical protein